jgi:hypothetical protein
LKRIVADRTLHIAALNEGSTVPAARSRAERPDHVWAIDYRFDQTADGRILELLNVVDEFTREALAIECRRIRAMPISASFPAGAEPAVAT